MHSIKRCYHNSDRNNTHIHFQAEDLLSISSSFLSLEALLFSTDPHKTNWKIMSFSTHFELLWFNGHNHCRKQPSLFSCSDCHLRSRKYVWHPSSPRVMLRLWKSMAGTQLMNQMLLVLDCQHVSWTILLLDICWVWWVLLWHCDRFRSYALLPMLSNSVSSTLDCLVVPFGLADIKKPFCMINQQHFMFLFQNLTSSHFKLPSWDLPQVDAEILKWYSPLPPSNLKRMLNEVRMHQCNRMNWIYCPMFSSFSF